MPLPKTMTRFNRQFANPALKKLARRLPMMGVVIHRGRNSGRSYETPVLAFPRGDIVTFAMFYGADVDWLKNVRAAGQCLLVHRGQEWRLAEPEMLQTDEGRRRMPGLIQLVLRLLRVDHYLEMSWQPQRVSR